MYELGEPLPNWPVGEIRQFEGHESGITTLAFSPDGRYFLSACGQRRLVGQFWTNSKDNSVRCWVVETGRLLFKLEGGHKDGVQCVAYSPKGAQALSIGSEKSVWLWNLPIGKPVAFEAESTNGLYVAFFQNARHALFANKNGIVTFWDLVTEKKVGQMTIQKPTILNCLALSHDNRFLAAGSNDGMVRLWDVRTGVDLREFRGHQGAVWSVAFSPQGDRILSGSEDKTVRVWESATGREVGQLLGHESDINSLAVSPDGTRALSGSGNHIREGDGSFGRGRDNTVRLWDLQTGRQVIRFLGHRGSVACVAFSPDGRSGLSGSHDGTLRLWGLPRPGQKLKEEDSSVKPDLTPTQPGPGGAEKPP